MTTSLFVHRPLHHSLPHLNDSPQPFEQVHQLVRGQAVLVQDVVNDRVLSLSEGMAQGRRFQEC